MSPRDAVVHGPDPFQAGPAAGSAAGPAAGAAAGSAESARTASADGTAPVAPTGASAAPGARRHHSRRAVLAAALAGILTLTAVIGLGRWLGGSYLVGGDAVDTYPDPLPSSDWTSGSQVTWTMTIASDATVFTLPGYVFALETGTDSSAATLTAYSLADTGPTQRWTTTVDVSHDQDSDVVGPTFMPAGSSMLVHGASIYQLATGERRGAPWDADDTVLTADGTVIACSADDSCRGWTDLAGDPAWTTTVPGVSTDLEGRLSSRLITHHRGASGTRSSDTTTPSTSRPVGSSRSTSRPRPTATTP